MTSEERTRNGDKQRGTTKGRTHEGGISKGVNSERRTNKGEGIQQRVDRQIGIFEEVICKGGPIKGRPVKMVVGRGRVLKGASEERISKVGPVKVGALKDGGPVKGTSKGRGGGAVKRGPVRETSSKGAVKVESTREDQ